MSQRRLGRALGVLAIAAVAMFSVALTANVAVAASSSASAHKAAKKPAKKVKKSKKRPAYLTRASARRTCVSTVRSVSTRRLSRTQRGQLRRYKAYKVPRRKARKATRKLRARPARRAGWICIRTKRQEAAVRTLTKPLGPTATSREVQQVSVPKTLDGRLTIDTPGNTNAGWSMLDAPKAPVQLFEHGALYSTGEYDVVQEIRFGTLKESIAVHRRQGTRTWRWRLAWKGGEAPTLQSDGTIRYGDRVTIRAPFLQDRRGKRLRNLKWKLDGNVLSVTFNDRKLPLPYVLDPASDYPVRIHPTSDYVTGSSAIQGLITPPLGSVDTASGAPAGIVGDVFLWSGNTNGHHFGGVGSVTNASAPNPQNMNGTSTCTVWWISLPCNGALGWAQEALGGATLAAGPYTVQSRIQYNSGNNGNLPVVARLKARLWKVKFSPDTDIQAGTPTAITGWSTGPARTWNSANEWQTLTTTLAPGALATRFLAPDDHVYIEYVLEVTDAGNSSGTFRMSIKDPNTFIDFGGPATNTPGAAGNLRISAPSYVGPTGWTNDSTPRLRADLDDPDWWHHVVYQTSPNLWWALGLRNGQSAASQMYGGTNNHWDLTPALANGTYYMRAHTQEDGGDAQTGPWTSDTNTCTGTDIGPCGQFGVDTVSPAGSITAPATGSWYRGTVGVSGTATDAGVPTTGSGVQTRTIRWRRTAPAAAGPATTGVACTGPLNPVTCTWDTTQAAGDGTYELLMEIVDFASNTTNLAPYGTILVDNTAPVWQGAPNVDDGPGPGDLTWVNSNDTLEGRWNTAVDAVLLNRYEYCIATSSTCASGIVKGWTSSGLATSHTSSGLTLSEGSTYYLCVRAIDHVGNVSSVICSNGQTVDTQAPAITAVNDGAGADITWNLSTVAVAGNWTGNDVASGIQRWEYCINTAADCTSGTPLVGWTSNGTSTSVSSTGHTLPQGATYYVCVRGFDNAGNVSAVSCSNGQRVDTLVPTSPAEVRDGTGADEDWSNDAATLHANWDPSADLTSGVASYDYCISTSGLGTDCNGAAFVSWTSNGSSTSMTRGGLSLAPSTRYYVCVRAHDNATWVGFSTCSDGIEVDDVPPTATWSSWSESSIWLHASGDRLWFNPAATGGPHSATAIVHATDAGSGVASVDFPNLAAGGWSAGGAGVSGAGDLWSWTYDMTAPAGDPADATATAYDVGGLSDTVGFRMDADANAPTGMLATITSGLQNASTVNVGVTPGTEPATESGVASWQLEFETGTLSGDFCSAWSGTWNVAASGVGAAPASYAHDVTALGSQCYRYRLSATDNVNNTGTSAVSNARRVDLAPPVVAITAPTNGSAAAGTVAITGTATDVHSTIASVTLTITGPDATSCAPVTVAAGAFTCSWDTSTLADGNYTITATATDAAGNVTTSSSSIVLIDNFAPEATFVSWDDHGSSWMHTAGDVAWVNPNGPIAAYTLTADVDARDAGSGVDRVEFPALGAGWSPAAAADATLVDPQVAPLFSGYELDYGFSAPSTIADPGAQSATAYDGAGNAGPVPFTIRHDPNAPTGMQASVTAGLQGTGTINVGLTPGAEPATESGVASWQLEFETGTLGGDSCSAWSGTWNVAASGVGAAPASHAHDVTALGSQCYRYRLSATDNVNNTGTSAVSNARRVDLVAPSVAITAPADGSAAAGTVAITGTTTDVHSAVTSVTLAITGPGATGCSPATLAAGTFTCSWDTSALADGWYTITATATDAAGNATTSASSSVLIDNFAPESAFVSWDDHGSTWMHAAGNIAWVNPTAPAGAYTLTADVDARDAGSGVDHVEFPALGAGWSPAGAANATLVDPQAHPLFSGYTFDYGFSDPSVLVEPGLRAATAVDGAGNGGPVSFDIRLDDIASSGTALSPVSGLQSTTSITRSMTIGTDAHSGVASYAIETRLAPLEDGVCGAWDAWTLGTPAAASDGATLAITHWFNDANQDGTPEYHDSFCAESRARVFDNVGNVELVPANGVVMVDFRDPEATISGPADGVAVAGTTNVTGTADDLWEGVAGEYADTGSGLDRVTVTWTAPDSSTGQACTPITTFGGTWDAHTWSCAWDTTLMPVDGWYDITVQARDNAGRVSAPVTYTYLVDNFAPEATFVSWDDHGSAWMHTSGDTAWVNPTAPAGAYTLTADVDARDAGSGVDRVEFPAFGASWSPAVTTDATLVDPQVAPLYSGYELDYTFSDPSSISDPGVQSATAFDGAGNSGQIPFTVRHDANEPTGMQASITAGLQSSGTITVGLTPGTEPATESGVASWQLEYETGTLSDDTCSSWSGTWNVAASGVGAAPTSYAHDVSLLGSQCYRYRLSATDNVSNTGTSAVSNARRVDLDAPMIAITNPIDGSFGGGTISIEGDADDAESGIVSVLVSWTGPSAGTCIPVTVTAVGSAWTFDCDWDTTLSGDGTYVISVISVDLAGNASAPVTATVTVDNVPPYVAFHSFDETSAYTHWAGPTGNTQLWYNPAAPAGTYAFDVHVQASDGNGIDRVEFGAPGAGWTPGPAVATQTAVGVAPDRYVQTYSFDTSGAGPTAPGPIDAAAFDHSVGTDSVQFQLTPDVDAPVVGSISSADGFVPSTSVTVSFDTGSDADSGIAGWELLRDEGTLTAGACTGWSGYASSVATGSTATSTGSFNDTVTDPGCFRYRLVVTDNVGNVATLDAIDVVMVDLAPPTGSLTISVGAGAASQYLDTPTRLYVNTNLGHSGSFDVEVTGAAASGLLQATFPVLSAGFTGDGVQPGPGPNFTGTYSWTGPSAAPGTGLSVELQSNSLGTVDLPFEVIADATGPAGGSATHPDGYTTVTSTTVTYAAGTDAGSGLAGYQLQREDGTLSNGACTWSGTWSDVGPAGGASYTDNALTHATCHRYRVEMTDNVGNVGASAPSDPIMVDTTAPTLATVEFVEDAGGYGTALAGPSTIYYRSDLGSAGTPATFELRVHIVDPESGAGTVTFPTIPGNWNGGAVTDHADGQSQLIERWATAVEPGTVVAIARNGAGLATTANGSILADDVVDAAAAWSISYPHGFDVSGTRTVTWTDDQTDALSGFASYELVRRAWPFQLGTGLCDHTATPVDTSFGAPAGGTYTDNGLVVPTCYRYLLLVTDNAENEAEIWADGAGTTPALFDAGQPGWDRATVAEVNDVTPPDAFDLVLPTNPALPAITTGTAAPSCATTPTFTSATPTLQWTPSADSESGLASYDVFLDDMVTAASNVAAPGVSWNAPSLTDGAHTIGVRALDNQNNGTEADPGFPTTIRVDTAPPSAGLLAPTDTTWTGDTTPTLSWTATDANCVARVEVYVDDMVNPVAVTSGSESSFTVPSALTDGVHSWRVEAIDTAGNRTSSATFTLGIDTTPPTAFSITTPTNGTTVRGFVDVTWSATTDAESGMAAATAYSIFLDGSLVGTVDELTTTFQVPGITIGAHQLRVDAHDAVGNVRSTADVTIQGYGPIPAPVLVQPLDGSFWNAMPQLEWSWPDDTGPAPTGYEAFIDGVSVGTTAHPVMQLTAADPGDGLYDWHVEQTDPYTGVVSSATATFMIDTTAPANPGPITRVGTELTWSLPSDPATPVASGVDYVELRIDDGINPTIVTPLPANATSQDYGMLPDGNYTMVVRVYDRAGNSSDALINVTNDSLPPDAFDLDEPAPLPALPAITNGDPSPSCTSALTYTSALPTFTWQASFDAVSGLKEYDVVIDGAVVATVPAGTTSWTAVTPLTGGAHQWSVVARDNFLHETASTPTPMLVRVDGATPTVALSNPADNGYTANDTPTLSWNAGDDNCVARVEVTLDGAVQAMLTGTESTWTVPAPLTEGAHTWSVRVIDSVGNDVTSATRTFTVDQTGPTGVTAVSPANAGSIGEGMLTFDWTAGTDAASGISHYALTIDGVEVDTSVVGTSRGTFPIEADGVNPLNHTWMIRAYDNVGNYTDFPFSFDATYVPDVTPPDAFHLLTPADNAPLADGDDLTWEAAWDFKGIDFYKVFIDGAYTASVPGTSTVYTPSTGSGSPLCGSGIQFPATSAGCSGGAGFSGAPAFSSGAAVAQGAYPNSQTGVPAGPHWNIATYPGWSASGAAIGVGDPTVAPVTNPAAGFEGDRVWTAMSYDVTVPADGANLTFEHRYRMHMVGDVVGDGGSVELSLDGGATWEPTCIDREDHPASITLDCEWEIMEADGGFNGAIGNTGGPTHPNYHKAVFSGTAASTVKSTLRLVHEDLVGRTIKVRFRIGTDGCYVGMPAGMKTFCDMQNVTNPIPALWFIDDINLVTPAIAPGLHEWYVVAVDPSGNERQSTETWHFDLQPAP